MDEIIFLINKVLISGTVLGSIYAMGAIGVTLIYGILRFAHFAHGDMMTMGSFIAFVLAILAGALGIEMSVPLAFLVLPVAMFLTSVIALGLDRAFYAPLRARGASSMTLMIASIGVTLMIQGLIRLIFGSGTRNIYLDFEQKVVFRIDLTALGGTRPVVITEPQLLLFAVTLACILGLHYFLTRSRMGKAMRATADNPDLAQVSGINTQQVVIVTWMIAGALACLAGTMLALDVNLRPDLAFNIILPIFAASVVGGLGNTYGAIAGGLLIGFAESLAVFNWTVVLRPFAAYHAFRLGTAGQPRPRADRVQAHRRLRHPGCHPAVASDRHFQGIIVMRAERRTLLAYLALAVFVILVGTWQGPANLTLLIAQTTAYALIALGLNIQFGYGGLSNFGVMGFLMVGGATSVFFSYPIKMEFWTSDGPWLLLRAFAALAVGGLVVFGAHRLDRLGVRGRLRSFLVLLAWFVGYVLYRSQLDPAAAYIESTSGWIGGLGLYPVIGWIMAAIVAALIGRFVAKTTLGLRADYLGIATIGISEILRSFVKNMDWLTRGTLSVSPVPWPVPVPQDLQAIGVSRSATASFMPGSASSC